MLVAFATVAPAQADFISSCPAATTQVYAFTCADTSNTENGAQLFIDNGQLIAGKTGSNSFVTTSLGAVTPGQAIRGGAFGVDQGTTGLNANTTEAPQLPGSGKMTASAQVGNTVDSTWNAIPFSNANPHDTELHFRGNSVIPNLHAIASGSIDQPDDATRGGQSVQASATASFSDVVSISEAQIDALGSSNFHGSEIYVELSYVVHGTATFSPDNNGSGGEAIGSFDLTVRDATSSTNAQSADGGFDLSSLSNQEDLLDEQFSLRFLLKPGDAELISAQLSTSGIATDSGFGPAASFDSNLNDTAQFLGAKFFADAAGTILLPTLELNSQFGFNYAPVTIVSDVGGAPEPAIWLSMIAGLVGIGCVFRKMGGLLQHCPEGLPPPRRNKTVT